jgi:hypothetical protein
MPNKAKFQNAENEHKSLFHNDYEQQTTNNELIKTKPNKPKFYSPIHVADEPNFTRCSVWRTRINSSVCGSGKTGFVLAKGGIADYDD